MSVLSPAAISRGSARPTGRPSGATTPRDLWSTPAVVAGVPGALALALSVAWSWNPSFWMDETASISAARRGVPALMVMLGHVDAVHGLYYLFLHFWTALFGLSEFAVRLPSAVGAAAAAAALAMLGRRLGGPRAGLLAGTVYALLPVTSYYGMDARAYSWVVFLAITATYCFVRARAEGGRWFLAYAASVAALGWVFMLGVTLLAAHAVVVLAGLRRGRRALRPALAWAAAAGAGIVGMAPMMWLAAREHGQLSWDRRPALADLAGYPVTLWFARALPVAAVFWGVIVVALVVLRRRRASGARSGRGPLTGDLALLALSWLLAPVVLLFLVSQHTPLLARRYLLFCVAGGCLLVGAALATLRPRVAAAVVGLLALVAVPTWVANREVTGQGSTLRVVAEVIHAHHRPGDAVVYLTHSRRGLAMAYPRLMAGVRDVELRADPVRTGTLWGWSTRPGQTARRLSGVDRVWVVNALGLDDPSDGDPARLRTILGGRFAAVGRWGGRTTEAVTLYDALTPGRRAAPAISPRGGTRPA